MYSLSFSRRIYYGCYFVDSLEIYSVARPITFGHVLELDALAKDVLAYTLVSGSFIKHPRYLPCPHTGNVRYLLKHRIGTVSLGKQPISYSLIYHHREWVRIFLDCSQYKYIFMSIIESNYLIPVFYDRTAYPNLPGTHSDSLEFCGGVPKVAHFHSFASDSDLIIKVTKTPIVFPERSQEWT